MPFWTLAFSGGAIAGAGMSPALALPLGIFLVFLNGFFVAAEFALVKVRPTQIEPHVKAGDRRAKVADHMVEHLDAYLSATQLGITLASLALGWIGEPAFATVLEPIILAAGGTQAMVHTISLTTAFLIITVLHIVLGELAPKSIAIRRPEATTLWIAIPLYVFYKVSYPAIYVLNKLANALLKVVGIQPVTESELAQDEEEVRRLLASAEASDLSPEKRELLDNIFELSHRNARQVMVPRADVIFLDTEADLEESLGQARMSGHTRFPLCTEDLDQVVGMIHIKDLFRAKKPPTSLQEIRREIAFVPETLPLDRLLRRMLRERIHFGAVLDEYGGVSGIVTLENVIEEIVGEIQDEFDLERPEFVRVSENHYIVAGAMLVKDLEDELGLELSDRDEDTIGGVALSELGRRARPGDTITVGPIRAEVTEIDRNRIHTLRVKIDAPPPIDPEVLDSE